MLVSSKRCSLKCIGFSHNHFTFPKRGKGDRRRAVDEDVYPSESILFLIRRGSITEFILFHKRVISLLVFFGFGIIGKRFRRSSSDYSVPIISVFLYAIESLFYIRQMRSEPSKLLKCEEAIGSTEQFKSLTPRKQLQVILARLVLNNIQTKRAKLGHIKNE